jgi:hypothetical protein
MKQMMVELSKKQETLVEKSRSMAKVIFEKFTDAAHARMNDTTHFENGLEQELTDCHDVRRGRILADEKEVAAELQHVGLEFGKRKAIAAMDVINDLVRQSIDAPILEPTPVAELPQNIKLQILDKLKRELFLNQFSGDLAALTNRLKVEASGTLEARAKAAATKAEKKVRDLLLESDFRVVCKELIDDFVSMPYCVAKSPSYEMVEKPYWAGNEWKVKMEVQPRTKRIDPFDFYILNGTTPHNAEAVFEISYVPESSLADMKDAKHWRKEEIEIIIERRDDIKVDPVTSQAFSGLLNRRQYATARMTQSDSKRIIWFYGRMRGEDLLDIELKSYGSTKIEPLETYEVCAAECEGLLIHLRVLPANSAKMRPYHVASYEKLNGSWAGIGVLQRVRKAERVARSFLYSALRNAAYSATPTGEIDYSRLQEYYPDQDDLQEFLAGHLYLVSSDRSGMQGGKKAVDFYNVPNNTAAFLSGLTFFLDLVDMLSAVPKLGTGDMRGLATLGRSYRGIALVQQAEAKTIRAALDNFDQLIQEPIMLSKYRHLMEYGNDPEIKGDAQIVARSTSGYLQKEANAAARQETLNSLIGLAKAGIATPELLQSAALDVMRDQGINVERFYNADNVANGTTPGAPTGAEDTGMVQPTSPGFGGAQVPV